MCGCSCIRDIQIRGNLICLTLLEAGMERAKRAAFDADKYSGGFHKALLVLHAALTGEVCWHRLMSLGAFPVTESTSRLSSPAKKAVGEIK